MTIELKKKTDLTKHKMVMRAMRSHVIYAVDRLKLKSLITPASATAGCLGPIHLNLKTT